MPVLRPRPSIPRLGAAVVMRAHSQGWQSTCCAAIARFPQPGLVRWPTEARGLLAGHSRASAYPNTTDLPTGPQQALAMPPSPRGCQSLLSLKSASVSAPSHKQIAVAWAIASQPERHDRQHVISRYSSRFACIRMGSSALRLSLKLVACSLNLKKQQCLLASQPMKLQ